MDLTPHTGRGGHGQCPSLRGEGAEGREGPSSEAAGGEGAAARGQGGVSAVRPCVVRRHRERPPGGSPGVCTGRGGPEGFGARMTASRAAGGSRGRVGTQGRRPFLPGARPGGRPGGGAGSLRLPWRGRFSGTLPFPSPPGHVEAPAAAVRKAGQWGGHPGGTRSVAVQRTGASRVPSSGEWSVAVAPTSPPRPLAVVTG